jgi:hypothetical protein
MSIRSVTSARAVSTNRSAKAFARGLRGGIFTASMPAAARTASNDAVSGDPEDVRAAGAGLHDEQAVQRWRVTAQSTWKKSVASIVAACVCGNCRQVASVRRSGAGGIFRVLRIRRMVDALTRWPSLSSPPRIRWYPQPLFSVASRSISAAISALIGGRPMRFG